MNRTYSKEQVRIFKLSNPEKEVYERVEFTFWQKVKFYFLNSFRVEIEEMISEYDFNVKIYQDNQDIFEEIEESASIILGGVSLERSLNKVRREQNNKKKRTLESYQMLLENLKEINKFYNEWNLERHEQYKKCNCKRLLLDLKSRFDEGAKYVVLLKTSGKTTFSALEKQLENQNLNENKYIICENRIFYGDYFIGLELDGVILKRGCSYMDIYEILWDGFSYLPITKLWIKEY